MSKGSKQRPTNHDAYASNHEAIFGAKILGRKYDMIIVDECQDERCDCVGFCTGICRQEKETCPYCGILTNSPCDGPQNNCEQANNKVHGAWLNDLNSR
jgi:hypothetical protein